MGDSLVDRAVRLFAEIDALPEAERIDVINAIRLALHAHSPFREEPVDCVLWVPSEAVQANNYNPNTVAPPEMALLALSIEEDGFTQPIVTYPDAAQYTVVDGFHRNRVGKEYLSIRSRIKGYLPITRIRPDRSAYEARIAATIRHNRARGKHGVQGMSQIVRELAQRNWSDAKIGKQLGMEPDEVLRLKQITGLADLFADRAFSEAWEAELFTEEPPDA